MGRSKECGVPPLDEHEQGAAAEAEASDAPEAPKLPKPSLAWMDECLEWGD